MTVQAGPMTKAGQDMLNDLEVLWGKQAWGSFPWADTIVGIEQEARRNIVERIEAEGVVEWGDEGHRARFIAWLDEAGVR